MKTEKKIKMKMKWRRRKKRGRRERGDTGGKEQNHRRLRHNIEKIIK